MDKDTAIRTASDLVGSSDGRTASVRAQLVSPPDALAAALAAGERVPPSLHRRLSAEPCYWVVTLGMDRSGNDPADPVLIDGAAKDGQPTDGRRSHGTTDPVIHVDRTTGSARLILGTDHAPRTPGGSPPSDGPSVPR